ncbi:hypothetical protein M011DRAFT_399049 [Sporormia fimetaria CBS 119925]|uniref:Zn(2)-C6 fungal-type domain-containing protein n=1 Tax=Sporormia fimetaria CBS 119925 TaxID=1340428 RepID=A0A6A6VHC9_9PLEO|nr:hypothetical protein M011DRAFT_399049 [Sporormia fimetaria CBS 119925]
MAVGIDRRVRKVASRAGHPIPVQYLSEAMPDHSVPHSYEVGLPVTNIAAVPPESAAHGQITAPSPPQHLNKKRRPSKGRGPPEIRRSSSTPHMRNMALTQSGELSPTVDKRRNKLGYHRTSVACGHCRRRKIRCLVAADDAQGRCTNCIRLKKECNFHPVEQAPENHGPQPMLVKEGINGAPASATSSPRHPSFSTTPSQTPTSRLSMRQQDGDVDSHRDSATAPSKSRRLHMHHPPYAYPPPIETQWATPSYLPSSSVAEASPSSSGFWRPSPSAPGSAYGSEPVSGGQTPQTMSSTSHMPYGRPGDQQAWTQPQVPPTRSMSYGNIEGLPQQFANSSLGTQQQDYPRRTPTYPYPIDTNPSTVQAASLSGTAPAPLSAPLLSNQQFGYPPPWNQYGSHQPAGHDMQGRSMSAQWFQEPGRLDRVQEEAPVPILYSQPLPQFYSGS